MSYRLYNGDCLEEMKNIPDNSIDFICSDLPYGSTDCEWDKLIPFDKLWEQYKRILKTNGTVALFGDNGLFTAKLIMSNEAWFKYNWILKKSRAVGFLHSKFQPLRNIETISIFYNPKCKRNQRIYNPQMTSGKPYIKKK